MKNVRIITLLNPWRLQAADGRTVVAKVLTVDRFCDDGTCFHGRAIELDASDGTLPHRADVVVVIPLCNVIGVAVGVRANPQPVAADPDAAPDPVALTGPFTIQSSALLRAYGGTGAGGHAGGGGGDGGHVTYHWNGRTVRLK